MTSYTQFCPVSTATDVLGARWAILVVRSLLAGNRRFRDIERGVPGCPPATLSKRLKELTAAGIVCRSADGDAYELTDAGRALHPVVEELGRWAHQWAQSSYEGELDPEVLMWDLRDHLAPDGLGVEEAVVQVSLRNGTAPTRQFWMVVDPGEVDVCFIEPRRAVDVVVDASLLALTRIWRGEASFDVAMDCGEIELHGPRRITQRIPSWLATHPVLSNPDATVCDREPAA